ncbi:unnamed protein product (macronuclear) [Paramecium tetraurelia]|uniref:Cytochrome b5 heme-binding domain-containing protein n=1 Tax=Paramecium tetraurelia TaxID=5888 RepID=A0DWF1_PARTE|nr:uncharacterized protein GSPATT00021010001 [Paramecium tetraurelia]CAK87368.1 unnamed protein product [Paramecium tetraurelia]|eukprot:XP_001454765.1 hypothetical protein (macronuclear) [Paramecium tetraurelia strain d4-2]
MIPSLPSRGKQLLESPFIWLKEKAEMDRKRTGVPSNMWYVQGKIYDLSKFLKEHPGGENFLKLTQGQDITEMYFAHHLNLDKCQAILSKYYVREADRVQQYFNFDQNGFYRTLHRRVGDYFKVRDKGPSLSMKLTVISALFAFCLTFGLTCIHQSFWWALLCGYTLFVCFGIAHNFMHQGAKQPLRYMSDLLFFSHYHWVITHCISHHHYPNSNIDFEMTSMEPFFITTKSRLPNNRFLPYYINIVFGFISTLQFISTIIQIIKGEEQLRKEYLIPVIEYFIIYSFCLDGTLAFKLFMAIQCFASFLSLKYPLIIHRNSFNYSDGSTIQPSNDYGIYVIQTTTDHDLWIQFPLNMFLFQSFNHHILHHMFPTVDESRIPEIHHILEQTLKDFNLQDILKKYNFFELYKSHNEFLLEK